MLVLSRKVGQSINIGGQIEVRVIAIEGQRVRLGIEAPAEVPILRSELAPWPIASGPVGSSDDSPADRLSATLWTPSVDSPPALPR